MRSDPARGARFLQLALVAAALSVSASAFGQAALPRAHAHNDYAHRRPLLDALDHGFCSVEADIFVVGRELLVAHDREDIRPERTLQRLYLDPLRERVRAHNGRVYPGGPSFTLLIDFKSEAEPTYAVLREVLAGYREMLTVFREDRTETNAVTVVLSGNRPRALVEAEAERLVAIDGRLPDLEANPSPHVVPLISDNWRSHFRWIGEGPFPEDERTRLVSWVLRAHDQGRRIRFWGAPDTPAAWQALFHAGVDLINTDRLGELAAFLRPRPGGTQTGAP